MKENLLKELNNSPFSLLIDEWSDLNMKPHLGLVVLYYSQIEKKISSRFLELIELDSVNSDGIFEKIEKCFEQNGLAFDNLVGYGSDGANVVSGSNNSVWTRLKAKNPNLIRFTCICHSLAKVGEEAFNELPSRMSAILKMIPKWFRKSDKRKSNYKKLFDEIPSEAKPMSTPFEKYSETRWLCRAKTIRQIIDNWDLMTQYFIDVLPELKMKPNSMLF